MRDSVVYWVLGIVYCYMGNYNSNCQISMYAIYDAQLTKLEIAEQWDEWYGTNQNKDMMHEG